MTDLYAAADSISGEKIIYCFGSMSGPSSAAGGLKQGTFSNHGWARVQKPLKRSRSLESRERDQIICKSARYRSRNVRQYKQRVTCGNHTCLQGFLKGDAQCTIQTPMENIPGAGD